MLISNKIKDATMDASQAVKGASHRCRKIVIVKVFINGQNH
jgi:hypothetical protein